MAANNNPSLVNFGIHSGYFHQVLREWQQLDTQINPANLMYPIFLSQDPNAEEEIQAMPDIKRWGLNTLDSHLGPLVEKGLKSVLLFGVIKDGDKDETGSSADDPTRSPVIPVIQKLRKLYPDLLIACDVCLCGYTSHGHCGILKDTTIDNELSIQRLAQISMAFASAGAQVIAPSDMMDGRILAIKKELQKAGMLRQVSVLSYAAKFSSCFYGPFRSAACSAPSFGDRRAYQLPSGSSGLAMRAVDRDVAEGADMLMVKPAGSYMDIIQRVKSRHPELPLFAYQVSGEYSMLRLGAQNKLFNLNAVIKESLVSLRRAGTDVIITYFTPIILNNPEILK